MCDLLEIFRKIFWYEDDPINHGRAIGVSPDHLGKEKKFFKLEYWSNANELQLDILIMSMVTTMFAMVA